MSTAIFPQVWEMLQNKAISEGDGLQVPAMRAQEYGFHEKEDITSVDGKSTPQFMACFTENLLFDLSIHKIIPAHYIHCRKSSFLSNMCARAQNMGIPVHEMNTGHFPMIEAPAVLASYMKRLILG